MLFLIAFLYTFTFNMIKRLAWFQINITGVQRHSATYSHCTCLALGPIQVPPHSLLFFPDPKFSGLRDTSSWRSNLGIKKPKRKEERKRENLSELETNGFKTGWCNAPTNHHGITQETGTINSKTTKLPLKMQIVESR